MSYVAEISRSRPTAIVMVVDQSTSMSHQLASGQTKSAFLSDVLNKTLYTLITSCSKADGVRDYFDIGVIAYSGEGARNGFEGELGTKSLNAVSRLADKPLRVETRLKKIHGKDDQIIEQNVKFPIWFEPKSRGKTSMCAGLSMALDVLTEWCVKHPTAFPPTVLHVTDGHPTDGNPEPIAEQLKRVGTEDGPCLIFNLHVDVGGGLPLLLPPRSAVRRPNSTSKPATSDAWSFNSGAITHPPANLSGRERAASGSCSRCLGQVKPRKA